MQTWSSSVPGPSYHPALITYSAIKTEQVQILSYYGDFPFTQSPVAAHALDLKFGAGLHMYSLLPVTLKQMKIPSQ